MSGLHFMECSVCIVAYTIVVFLFLHWIHITSLVSFPLRRIYHSDLHLGRYAYGDLALQGQYLFEYKESVLLLLTGWLSAIKKKRREEIYERYGKEVFCFVVDYIIIRLR